MSVSQKVAKSVGEALKSARAGDAKLASRKLVKGKPPTMQVASDWFRDGGSLPTRCTADGEGAAPPLSWSAPPVGTQSVVLVCEDPDAPMPEPFVHWLVYGIPLDVQRLDSTTLSRTREGKNSTLKNGFTPAAPPPGHGIHHYHFQVFALDTRIDLDRGVGRNELFAAMEGHVLQWGDLIGIYQR